MKNFNLFLAFLVCSSAVMTSPEKTTTPVAEISLLKRIASAVSFNSAADAQVAADAAAAQVAADAAAQAAIDAKLSTKVYNYTVKPVVQAATAVDGYVAQADASITSVAKKAKDAVVNFVQPATTRVATATKPATDTVVSVSQAAYDQLSAFAQRPAAMIIAAVVTYGVYAYATSNSSDEESKN